jgi:hypothetical protein
VAFVPSQHTQPSLADTAESEAWGDFFAGRELTYALSPQLAAIHRADAKEPKNHLKTRPSQ